MTICHGGYYTLNIHSFGRVPSFDFVPACKNVIYLNSQSSLLFYCVLTLRVHLPNVKSPSKDHFLFVSPLSFGQKRRLIVITSLSRPVTAFIASIGIHLNTNTQDFFIWMSWALHTMSSYEPEIYYFVVRSSSLLFFRKSHAEPVCIITFC